MYVHTYVFGGALGIYVYALDLRSWVCILFKMVPLDDAATIGYIMQSTTAMYVCNALSTCTYTHSLNIVRHHGTDVCICWIRSPKSLAEWS